MTAIIFIFWLTFTVQSIYFLSSWTALYYHKSTLSNTQEKATVIIAAHNEHDNLRKNLPQFLSQDHSQFEIIIVNDRSTDQSKEWLDQELKKNPHLRVIHIEETVQDYHPKKYALKKGIEAAQNELLVFTDADCVPCSKNWLSGMLSPFSQGYDIVLGVSGYFPKKGLLNTVIQLETLFTAFQYLSLSLLNMPYMGVGRNLAFRKSLFDKYNGYGKHQSVTGGDDDLLIGRIANRSNTTVVIHPDYQTLSEPKSHCLDWLKQKKRHLSVSKYYHFKHLVVLGSLQLLQISFFISALYLLIFHAKTLLFYIIGGKILLNFLVYSYYQYRLQWKVKHLLIPVFEFTYFLLYLPMIGLWSWISKKINW